MAADGKRIKLISPVGRVSFPNLFKPAPPMKGVAPNPNAKDKYGLTLVWTPTTFTEDDKKRWSQMIQLVDSLSMQHFKKKMKELPPNVKRPIRDGAEKAHLTGFGAGTYFSNITTNMKPGVVSVDNVTPIDDPEDLYAGCFARVSYTAYYYDNVSKGIALGLSNVKKIRDGDRLDSRTAADQDFQDLGEADVEYAGLTTEGEDFL
jgi:hypothetical protein